MPRKKVTLAYLTNNAERRASYRKRKKGLIKKVDELSTLCDVDACAIIYGKDEIEPEVYPSREKAEQVLEKFQTLSVENRTKKMANPEGYSQERSEKTEAQLQRLEKENMRNEMKLLLYRVMVGKASLQELDMSCAAEMKSVIKEIRWNFKSKMEELQGNDGHINMEPNNDVLPNDDVTPISGNIKP